MEFLKGVRSVIDDRINNMARHESRGGHWRSDYPAANPALAHRSFVRVSASGAIEPLVAGPTSRRNPNPVLVSLA